MEEVKGTHVTWKEATVGEKKKVEAEHGQDMQEESTRNLFLFENAVMKLNTLCDILIIFIMF